MDKMLVVFTTNEITDLVYIDSNECRLWIATRLRKVLHPSTILYPDFFYRPLQETSERYRKERKKGIVYPSSRHLRDWGLALFGDRTGSFKISACLKMRLALTDEATGLLADDVKFDPFSTPINYAKGYYSIDGADHKSFQHLLTPASLPQSGYIDLIRRKYSVYPTDAVSAHP